MEGSFLISTFVQRRRSKLPIHSLTSSSFGEFQYLKWKLFRVHHLVFHLGSSLYNLPIVRNPRSSILMLWDIWVSAKKWWRIVASSEIYVSLKYFCFRRNILIVVFPQRRKDGSLITFWVLILLLIFRQISKQDFCN